MKASNGWFHAFSYILFEWSKNLYVHLHKIDKYYAKIQQLFVVR